MAVAPSAALLLEAWETASAQQPARRPLTVLSLLTGRDRRELQALTVGERDGLILRLRAGLFGQELAALTTCASCGSDAELSFAVRDVLVSSHILREVTVALEGETVAARPLTAGDLEDVAGSPDLRGELFRRSVAEAVEVTDEALFEVGRALAEADPQAHIDLQLVCPSCQAASSVRFDPWTFLWEEIRSWAVRTLGQVHRLARAYGWSESEVLALSPQRRHTYLRLVGA
jgi:hypothetical protein